MSIQLMEEGYPKARDIREQILKEGFADLIILATPEEVEENSDGADVRKVRKCLYILEHKSDIIRINKRYVWFCKNKERLLFCEISALSG